MQWLSYKMSQTKANPALEGKGKTHSTPSVEASDIAIREVRLILICKLQWCEDRSSWKRSEHRGRTPILRSRCSLATAVKILRSFVYKETCQTLIKRARYKLQLANTIIEILTLQPSTIAEIWILRRWLKMIHYRANLEIQKPSLNKTEQNALQKKAKEKQ